MDLPESRSPSERLVQEKCAVWSKRLMDLTRRNRLVNYSALKKGTLPLLPEARGLPKLLAGKDVPLKDLLLPPTPPGEKPDGAEDLGPFRDRARDIVRQALTNYEERGVSTLFLAFDLVRWEMDGKAVFSPLALLPVSVLFEGTSGQRAKVTPTGELVPNPVLVAQWNKLHGVAEPALPDQPDVPDDQEGNERLDALRAWADEVCKRVPAGHRDAALSLDNFHFQKLAMYREMVSEEHLAHYASSPLVAALAGDGEARKAVTDRRLPDVDVRTLDRKSPDEEFLVLDADSSQLRIIEEVMQGQSGVIHGPPGTGKSQTIANLAAALAARGKRVLFVAEKRAALEVVKRRLASVGLGHLVLDLHGAEVSRKRIAAQLNAALTTAQATPTTDASGVHLAFRESRARLVTRMEALHTPRPGTDESLYEMGGHLPQARPLPGVRWRGGQLRAFTRERRAEVQALLEAASSFASIVRGDEPSRWMQARPVAFEAVLEALDAVELLSRRVLPELEAEAGRVLPPLGVRVDASLETLESVHGRAKDAAAALAPFNPSVENVDVDVALQALAPVERGWWAVLAAFLFSGAFRMARRAALESRAAPAGLSVVYGELKLLASRRRELREVAPTVRLPDALAALGRMPALVTEARAALARLDAVLPGQWLRLSMSELKASMESLRRDRDVAERLPEGRRLREALCQLGMGDFLEEVRRAGLPPNAWRRALQDALRASTVEEVRVQVPSLMGEGHSVLDEVLERFRLSDKERVRLAAARVRRAHGERVIQFANQHRDAFQVVEHEARKKAKHKAFRELMATAGGAVTTLCPCVMASPLSVSQLLPVKGDLFDVVIFDEASQVFPEDAVPALVRAPQAVVAGDPKQLPPTNFFATGNAEEEDAGAFEGVESILDSLLAFLPSMQLQWHYRSRDERLIAFSNRHIYQDGLVTFPGVQQQGAVSFEYAAPSRQDGDEDSSAAEVRLVVQRILEHARQHPERSLGVITMGVKHRDRLVHALDDALDGFPEAGEFFSAQREDRFFIKNLEQVQGDERDVIFLSVGYAPGADGKLRHNFGPLQVQGGERRLNVAVTRARTQMKVFVSFTQRDMDPAKCKADGSRMLRDYLAFAESGGRVLGGPSEVPVALNAFESDVRLALEANGVRVTPQLGVSSYRLDFAVHHPEQPGRYVLAIECDGASYHSAPTARDRDRLRQQHLESLGWRVHRIWSTDWFSSREAELARTLTVVREAVAAADEESEPVPVLVQEPLRQVAPPLPGRGPRPVLPPYDSIDDLPHGVIEAWVRWVQSDNLLRTEADIVTEVVRELGFKRTGKRIRERIEAAVGSVRANQAR